MFFLKKLIASFLIPPGVFIILFILIGFLAKESKIIRFIAFFSGLLLYLLSIEPCKDLLLYPLEKRFNISKDKNADVIVILGGGAYNLDSLKEDTANRLIAGYFVFKEINKPIVVSGGSLFEKQSDARLMGDILRKMGVENKKIIEENRSRSTEENARYVIDICRQLKFKKILLITSAYHMPRAVMLFKNKEFEIIPYPVDFKRQREYSVYSILPKFTALNGSIKAIREYIAIFILLL